MKWRRPTDLGKKKSPPYGGDFFQEVKVLLDVDDNAGTPGAACPTKAPLSREPYPLYCSGRQSRHSASVLPCGQNACTRLTARPIVVAKCAKLRFRLTANTAPASLLLLSQRGSLRWARFGSPLWGPGWPYGPWQKEIPALWRGFLSGSKITPRCR